MTEPFASLPAITPESLAFYQSACGIPDSDLWFEAVQDLAEDAAAAAVLAAASSAAFASFA